MTPKSPTIYSPFQKMLALQVDKALVCSRKLMDSIDVMVSLYRPRTQDEDEEFYSVAYRIPNAVALLCDLQQQLITDLPPDPCASFRVS